LARTNEDSRLQISDLANGSGAARATGLEFANGNTMDKNSTRELIKECETMVAAGLAMPAHRLRAYDVVKWVQEHPNSAFHELIDWTPKTGAAKTVEYRRGQMIAVLDQLLPAK
jgi:hypothetical protein